MKQMPTGWWIFPTHLNMHSRQIGNHLPGEHKKCVETTKSHEYHMGNFLNISHANLHQNQKKETSPAKSLETEYSTNHQVVWNSEGAVGTQGSGDGNPPRPNSETPG